MPSIDISVLTSFCAFGFNQSLSYVSDLDVGYIELYAFMQGDLPWLQSVNPISIHPRNIVHYLAEANAFEKAPAHLADDICKQIREKCPKKSIKISSVATFIPEIMAHDDARVYNAQNAIIFLIKLIRELHAREHPVLTLEIVAGSTLAGVWPAKSISAKQETFAVNRLFPQEAVTTLLKNLDYVLPQAEKSPVVVLCVEMEPGCLFTVGSGAGIERFCSGISVSETRKKCLALNLDIPHWAFIHNLNRGWVLDRQAVKDRIAHAHISDHSFGHFADARICAHHTEESFGEWISLLDSLDRRSQRSNGYSGFLTLELEGCFDIKDVRKSIEKMNDLITRFCV